MSLRRARIPIAAVMSSSLLAGVAVADSSGAEDLGHGFGDERRHNVGHCCCRDDSESAAIEILPPDESWGGLTRGELTAQWWQRTFTMPEEINPYTDTTGERCGYQQSGPIFIMPGSWVGSVERTCVVAEAPRSS